MLALGSGRRYRRRFARLLLCGPGPNRPCKAGDPALQHSPSSKGLIFLGFQETVAVLIGVSPLSGPEPPNTPRPHSALAPQVVPKSCGILPARPRPSHGQQNPTRAPGPPLPSPRSPAPSCKRQLLRLLRTAAPSASTQRRATLLDPTGRRHRRTAERPAGGLTCVPRRPRGTVLHRCCSMPPNGGPPHSVQFRRGPEWEGSSHGCVKAGTVAGPS